MNVKTKIFSGQLFEVNHGVTNFCKLETDNGHYSVMMDSMTEPSVATVFFAIYN